MLFSSSLLVSDPLLLFSLVDSSSSLSGPLLELFLISTSSSRDNCSELMLELSVSVLFSSFFDGSPLRLSWMLVPSSTLFVETFGSVSKSVLFPVVSSSSTKDFLVIARDLSFDVCDSSSTTRLRSSDVPLSGLFVVSLKKLIS